MKTTIIVTTLAAAAIILGLIINNQSTPSSATIPQPIQTTDLTFMYQADQCTDTRAAECAVFVASVIEACATAMETGGADIIADIRCARARKLITTKKDCIPCLCEQVKKRGWNWVECP